MYKSVLYKETGKKHILRNKPCEDFVAYRTNKEKTVYTVALSDGAGSYKRAEIGAEITATTCAALVADQFERLYMVPDDFTAQIILGEINQKIKEAALDEYKKAGDSTGESYTLLDYSATLLCVATHIDGRYLVFHVGDGAIVKLNRNQRPEILSRYQHSGAANQTTFVTVPYTDYFLQKGTENASSYLLMSDGPEEFLVNEVAIHPRVALLQHLGFFYYEEDMVDELSILTKELKDAYMTDDCSFAMLQDRRQIGNVFFRLEAKLRSNLFEHIFTKKELKQNREILCVLSTAVHGASDAHLARKLHVHSKKYIFKKMYHLINIGLVQYEDGKYYLNA